MQFVAIAIISVVYCIVGREVVAIIVVVVTVVVIWNKKIEIWQRENNKNNHVADIFNWIDSMQRGKQIRNWRLNIQFFIHIE